jgi:hypothetical protein
MSYLFDKIYPKMTNGNDINYLEHAHQQIFLSVEGPFPR